MTPILIKRGSPRAYLRASRLWDAGTPSPSGRTDVPLTDDQTTRYLASQLDLALIMFRDALETEYGPLFDHGLTQRSMFSTFPASDTPTKLRGPHLDSGTKVLVGLWYFADPRDSAGGDITVGGCEVPYGENVMVIFPNLTSAWHSVSERAPSRHPRRMINFLTECRQPLHGYSRDPLGRDRVYPVKAICPRSETP